MVELIQYALMVSVWYNAAIHSQTCGSCGGFARASQADFRVSLSQPIRAQHFFVCVFVDFHSILSFSRTILPCVCFLLGSVYSYQKTMTGAIEINESRWPFSFSFFIPLVSRVENV